MANGTGLTLSGKVNKVGEVIEVGNFSKRLLWLEIDLDSQYPQIVELEFLKDKTALLNPVTENSMVTVDINLRGKLFTNDKGTRFYNTLNGWRLKVDLEAKVNEGKKSDPKTNKSEAPPETNNEDDLPF